MNESFSVWDRHPCPSKMIKKVRQVTSRGTLRGSDGFAKCLPDRQAGLTYHEKWFFNILLERRGAEIAEIRGGIR